MYTVPSKNCSSYSSILARGSSAPTIDLIVFSRDWRPYLVSTLNLERSLVSVALRSPWVRAPRLSSLLATMLANLCSPESADMRKMYSGALTWLER